MKTIATIVTTVLFVICAPAVAYAEVDPGPQPPSIVTTERVTAVFCNDYNWATYTTTTEYELIGGAWVKGEPSTHVGEWRQRRSTPADWAAEGISDICAPDKPKRVKKSPHSPPVVVERTEVTEQATDTATAPMRGFAGVWVELETVTG